jgi:acid phosphatase (class A)
LAFLLLSLPALALLAADAPSAMPAAQPYPIAGQIDLTRVLAPPPNEADTRKELDTLLLIQKNRTPTDEAACIADQVISVFRFADVLGKAFTPARLPKTDALFMRVQATVHVPMQKAQEYWTRKRPPLVEPRLKPVGAVPGTAAYPSGHATAGNLMGTILADMVPEKGAALHARGVLFAYRRELAGVHYPSDVEAGKLAAAAIAVSLYQDPQFQADLASARAELRVALGLRAEEGGKHEAMSRGEDEAEEYKDKRGEEAEEYGGKKEAESKEAKEY